nr:hypothetical protein [uncultured Limnobacter sp.]
MSLGVQAPNLQQVSATELLQAGANTRRNISADEQKKINRFIQANALKQSPVVRESSTTPLANSAGQPQVDAKEQANSTALRGAAKKSSKRDETLSRKAYSTVFSSDEYFLEQDVQSLRKSLQNGSGSLIDLSSRMTQEQRALRKYLVATIAMEQPDIDPKSRQLLKKIIQQQLESNGSHIASTLEAVKLGSVLPLKTISLREFVKAYQLSNVEPQPGNSEILGMFMALKRNMAMDQFLVDLRTMRKSLVALLKREKTQTPSQVTATRQHLLVSRIRQLDKIHIILTIHQKFLSFCQKSNLENLPTAPKMAEEMLRAVSSPEVLAGINGLIKIAAGITQSRNAKVKNPSYKNMMIACYQRLVLQHEIVQGLYPSVGHRAQILDGLNKQVKANGILAAQGHAAVS